MVHFTDEIKKQLSTHILIGAIIILTIFFINTFLHNLLNDTVIINLIYALALVACFVFLIFAIFAFSDSLQKELEIRQKNELLKNLQSYTDSVENMATEVRKFRHDHANLMLGFHNHIMNNDIKKIHDYYKIYMFTFAEDTMVADTRLDSLTRIQVPEVKSILSFKLLHAQHLGINVYIEVRDTIANIDGYDLLDICRIIGILLDNAVEACQGTDSPVIKFNAFSKINEITFVLSNTCLSAPPLSKINEKGFSTKEAKRGLGLHTVSALLEKNDNITLRTSIENGEFIQVLSLTRE
jgi:two-component system sensor histidine kinase AgrC